MLMHILTKIFRFVVSGDSRAPVCVTFRTNGQQTAIVFVHGFGGDASKTWDRFPQYLTEDPRIESWDVYSFGYATSLRLDFRNIWAADPDLSVLARELQTVLANPPFAAYTSIALIAHSMGGLVVQKALLNRDLQNRVGHVVLFGTPSNGLTKARLGLSLKSQVRDMVAGGAFISALRKDWSKEFRERLPFRMRVVGGDRDQFVPSASSLDPFPDELRRVVPGDHVEIVKPNSKNHLSVVLVTELLLPKAPLRGAIDSARLAVEERRFADAVSVLLPKAHTIDEPALVQLALALDSIGREAEALKLLENRSGTTTSLDAIGVLAGRVKRRWIAERVANDWARAHALYSDGLTKAEAAADGDQAMYHSINVAFLELMITSPDVRVPDGVKKMAERTLVHAKSASAGHWRLASEAEALAMLGRLEESCEKYRDAVAERPGGRAIDSMYSQAAQVIGRVFGESGQAKLDAIFGLAAES